MTNQSNGNGLVMKILFSCMTMFTAIIAYLGTQLLADVKSHEIRVVRLESNEKKSDDSMVKLEAKLDKLIDLVTDIRLEQKKNA